MGDVQQLRGAFTEEQVGRLTGLTKDQLRYWDKTGFFEPTLAYENRRSPYSRIYSFDDVISLQVLSELRNKYRVPLQHLRKIRDRLALPQSTWAEDEIFVKGKKVYFRNEVGSYRSAETGEDTLPSIPLQRVVSSTKQNIKKIMRRSSDDIGQVSDVRRGGKILKYFSGTRIPVEVIREYYDDGYDDNSILSDYPTLTPEDLARARKVLDLNAA